MNVNAFLNEIEDSQKVPVDFYEVYERFRKYQTVVIETICEFHRICEKNNITYQMAYGSLLGVIRDHGQIPWDYDADVFVPCAERAKLVEALRRDLDSKFYFDCPENNDRYPHMILRVSPNGYHSEVIHLDVFFIAGIPTDEDVAKKYEKRLRHYAAIRHYHLFDYKTEYAGHPKSYLKFMLNKIRYSFYPLKGSFDKYLELCARYPVHTSSRCLNAKSNAGLITFYSKYFFDTILWDTDFGPVRIPVQYDAYLKEEFGDYMRVPSLENRISEIYRSLRHIELYQKLIK